MCGCANGAVLAHFDGSPAPCGCGGTAATSHFDGDAAAPRGPRTKAEKNLGLLLTKELLLCTSQQKLTGQALSTAVADRFDRLMQWLDSQNLPVSGETVLRFGHLQGTSLCPGEPSLDEAVRAKRRYTWHWMLAGYVAIVLAAIWLLPRLRR